MIFSTMFGTTCSGPLPPCEPAHCPPNRLSGNALGAIIEACALKVVGSPPLRLAQHEKDFTVEQGFTEPRARAEGE
jgi:hypothetical protein